MRWHRGMVIRRISPLPIVLANLDTVGRRQSVQLGELFRQRGHFERIYSSQWCRCRETARLLHIDQFLIYRVSTPFIRELCREMPH